MPNTTWTPPIAGIYPVDGVNYKYYLDGKNQWKVTSLDGSVYVGGGNVVLYVSDKIKIGSGMQIHIASGRQTHDLHGRRNGDDFGPGRGERKRTGAEFHVLRTAHEHAAQLRRQCGFCRMIYAPSAAFTLGGGGNNTYDFVGACVTQSAKMNGHYNFHFDEALKKLNSPTGYVVSAWNEL